VWNRGSAKINDGVGVKLNVMIVSSPVTCNSFVSSASTSMSASVSRGVVVDVMSRRDRYVVCGWRVVSGSCVTIGLKTQSLKGGAPTVRNPFLIAPSF